MAPPRFHSAILATVFGGIIFAGLAFMLFARLRPQLRCRGTAFFRKSAAQLTARTQL